MRRHGRHGPPARPSASPELSPLKVYDLDSNPSRPVRSSPLTTSIIQGLPLELIDRLRSFPLFASAPNSFLTAVGQSLRPQVHQAQDYIVTEGECARAMYWLVRGSIWVTSRDGESTYAELKPGAFFGEIGILMNMPRTATIIASARSLVVRLNKEDLKRILPEFPAVEKAIRDEAVERLAILEHKKKQGTGPIRSGVIGIGKRPREHGLPHEIEMSDTGDPADIDINAAKKRKSPSPTITTTAASTAFGKTTLPIRQILQGFPLFSNLPSETLHFLGINAEPCSFPPFTDIIKQGSTGREVYFIIQGEVEIMIAPQDPDSSMGGVELESKADVRKVRALKQGQYFGEVTGLQLAPVRTATVRSVDKVECLRITGEVFDGLWQKASPDVRHQMEAEAKQRLSTRPAPLHGFGSAADGGFFTGPFGRLPPTVTLSNAGMHGSTGFVVERPAVEPIDPDPFFGSELEVPYSKSRRSSLAPPLSSDDYDPTTPSPLAASGLSMPLKRSRSANSPTPSSPHARPNPPIPDRAPTLQGVRKVLIPDKILVRILEYLDMAQLMRVRRVCSHWHKLCSTHDRLANHMDLSSFNTRIDDSVIVNSIAPFAGNRARHVDISSCFHITDEAFGVLVDNCAANVRCWKMKSVWEVTGYAILDLVSRAPHLEEIDLSNCRKVGDNLLARIVGWITPSQPPGDKTVGLGLGIMSTLNARDTVGITPSASKLKRLGLSYCKNVQDRSMAYIAQHAASRLEEVDLTRCTGVTDKGFQQWAMNTFYRLQKLVLADCTYLSDQSIVSIANAARNLKELDLSFCCALSDTATEVLSLGLTQLNRLDLSFCGSAVSDGSLRCIGLHLLDLRFLSVRGCVRVTGHGVEAVIEGCRNLEMLDVSQCKNLASWLAAGGVQRLRARRCQTRFNLVADGSWRART